MYIENLTDGKKYKFFSVTPASFEKQYGPDAYALAGQGWENTIISALSGSKLLVSFSFQIVRRDDDYTMGTGTPVANNIEAESEYIEFDFQEGSDKKFVLYGFRPDGKTITGTIDRCVIDKDGNSPNEYIGQISFLAGVI